MQLDKIEVATEYKHLQIREIIQVPRLDENGKAVLDDEDNPVFDSGGYHRRVLTSDMDVSSEVQEIQDKAELEWTDDVKTAWTTFQEEQKAKLKE